jgi:hypothetical protein
MRLVDLWQSLHSKADSIRAKWLHFVELSVYKYNCQLVNRFIQIMSSQRTFPRIVGNLAGSMRPISQVSSFFTESNV